MKVLLFLLSKYVTNFAFLSKRFLPFFLVHRLQPGIGPAVVSFSVVEWLVQQELMMSMQSFKSDSKCSKMIEKAYLSILRMK